MTSETTGLLLTTSLFPCSQRFVVGVRRVGVVGPPAKSGSEFVTSGAQPFDLVEPVAGNRIGRNEPSQHRWLDHPCAIEPLVAAAPNTDNAVIETRNRTSVVVRHESTHSMARSGRPSRRSTSTVCAVLMAATGNVTAALRAAR